MIKRVHINQHVLKANRGLRPMDRQPPITCKTYCDNAKGFRLRILGPSEVVYSPDKPLDCGATVWIETTATVLLFDQEGRETDAIT